MDGKVMTVEGLILGLVGAVAGYMAQSALATRSKINEDLRAKRLTAYQPLWQMTGLLPLYPRSTSVTYGHLDWFVRQLRDWYFTQGGLLLSTESRQAYELLQRYLKVICELNRDAGTVIDDAHYTAVRERCSELRTELTNDLQSRTRGLFL